MLTTCPECELQISDKAVSCPHCGYPLKNISKTSRYKHSNRRRRLPNGFGQISEIKNKKLRKPFRVMVTVGKKENGAPICKLLKPEAYFETYNEAYAALVEYNRIPGDLDSMITVRELYERWIAEYSKGSTKKSVNDMNRTWRYCTGVYAMPARDLRARHIKNCIECGVAIINGREKQPTSDTKVQIKALFNLMLDYAVEYELVDRNYSRSFTLSEDIIKETKSVKKEHIPFSDDEIKQLWAHASDDSFVRVILIQCYTGWRPQEMCNIRLSDVDLLHGTITGGMKTDSGKNRIVPIHSRIAKLVEEKYAEAVNIGSQYLFNDTDSKQNHIPFAYWRYKRQLDILLKKYDLNPAHRPHDPRKHFVTMAKHYNVDEYAIKYIVGHAITDITERIYTKRELIWLKEEIEKII